MAFSDAFAKGYAIGDAAKKRRAASKFFKKFEELTREEKEIDKGEEVTEIGGIPVPASVITETGATGGAIPAEGTTPGAAIEAAIPPVDRAAATVEPALAPEEAISISAPEKIPLPQAAEARRAVTKSLTQNNIKELDRLAMEAARASGDIEVYTTLQKTTDSFLQSKVMRNLGLAQAASQQGDADAVEKHLRAAYRFIPDGLEPAFTKKDGGLYTKDPWSDEDIKLDSEMIGNLGTMIRDPEKWAGIVREERRERQKAGLEERKVAADEKRVTIFEQQVGLQDRELDLREQRDKIDALMAPIDRMNKFEQGMYYRALAAQAKATADNKVPELLDEARQMSTAIEGSMDAMITPPKQDFPGQVTGWTPSPDVMVAGRDGKARALNQGELNQAKGLAQSIAMTNRGAIGNNVAIAAGLQLIKAQLDPANFNAQIDLSTGTMFVPLRGISYPVKLPPELVQSLTAQQQKQAAPGPAPQLPFPRAEAFLPPRP